MFEFLCMVGVIVISLGFCVVILYSYFLKIVEQVGVEGLDFGKVLLVGLNFGIVWNLIGFFLVIV